MMKKLLFLMFICFSLTSACSNDAANSSNSNDQIVNENLNNLSDQTKDNEEENNVKEKEKNKEIDETKSNDPVENVKEETNEDINGEANESEALELEQETHHLILYFSDRDLMDTYRIKKEVEINVGDDLEKIAIGEWLKGPDHEELSGWVYSGVIVEYIEEVDGVAHVSLSKEILKTSMGSSGESMFATQIAMIMEQFGYAQTQVLVEGKVLESLFGHVYSGEPFFANEPDDFLWIDEKDSREITMKNDAFKIYEPAADSEVKGEIVVRGLARVYEGTVSYEFEDGHYILDEGFTTASAGGPGWGEFEIVIELDDVVDYSGRVILFEESAKDGSKLHELIIPVYVIE
ncbi:Gmad2 immunoglobulin-like domain-containing protein [Salipaludibacillus daqingensis]|uniref:Gmad2 immunoglobulin-like domain-containing protein n=1 Tax=Salipaludibacillus daqingensis TaxID=3041001 RepID=UPI0024753EB8|nr:Gmad2 immunoglobulin-like domain-containing protein [Salipaludibacillus daqingensis]